MVESQVIDDGGCKIEPMLLGEALNNYNHYITFEISDMYVITVDGTQMTEADIGEHQVTISLRDTTV